MTERFFLYYHYHYQVMTTLMRLWPVPNMPEIKINEVLHVYLVQQNSFIANVRGPQKNLVKAAAIRYTLIANSQVFQYRSCSPRP